MSMPLSITDTTAAHSSAGIGGGDMAFGPTLKAWELAVALGVVVLTVVLILGRLTEKKK